jgi:Putative peptidase family
MCQENHKIHISNLKNHELINNHRVVLIKGYVSNVCDSREILVVTKTNTKYGVSLQKYRNTNRSLNFKLLIRLQKNCVNHISVRYCSAPLAEIELVHRSLDPVYVVQPIYIVCQSHDGCFQSDGEQENTASVACAKIDVGLQLIQCLVAEKLVESGFGRKTFSIKSKCQIFDSRLSVAEAHSLSEFELWTHFGREILASPFGVDLKVKFVAFLGCTQFEGVADNDYSYKNIKSKTKGGVALGGGGLALFGSGCLYTWPNTVADAITCFENTRSVDITKVLDDSNYRRTYGSCFATTLGSVTHEIGHTFDLGHSEHGIMGDGFDYINRVFTVEHKTDYLPKRTSLSASTPTVAAPRFTKVKPPGEFLSKYQEQKNNDVTYFSENCSIILNFNKWLNNYATAECSQLHFDRTSHTVTSVSGYIKLIEIREPDKELVIKYWKFIDKSIAVFTLPSEQSVKLAGHVIFAIDDQGNTVKEVM